MELFIHASDACSRDTDPPVISVIECHDEHMQTALGGISGG